MSLSAFVIGRREHAKVWLIRTATVAESKCPDTLPLGATILSADEARRLAKQLHITANELEGRQVRG